MRDAISPADLQTVLVALHQQAVAGDVQAARVLLERCVGRPREEQPVVSIDLPEIVDETTYRAAMAEIVRVTAAGDLDTDVATRLAAVVQRAGDAAVLEKLSERVAAVERARLFGTSGE